MSFSVCVFDPIQKDKQSQVRGIGRYLQILKENFIKDWVFTDKIKQISTDSIFINPFYNFFQPPLIMKKIALKQIAVIHDLIPLKYPSHFPIGIKGKINLFLNKLSLKNYDLIVTDSQASKKDVIQILAVDEKRVKVVYPCLPKIFTKKTQITQIIKNHTDNIDLSLKSKILSIKPAAFCLYVGDATWNKNLVNLAKAIKIINVTCVFVGKVFETIKKYELPHPWQKELRQFIKETKNDRRFIFAGFVSDKELVNLYKQACCNILPSRDEGFGFSYIEASSQGCPSVLADIPVLKEISNSNALFADPNNINDLADKIGELYYNQTARKQITQKALKHSYFFSSSQFKKSFLNMLKNLST